MRVIDCLYKTEEKPVCPAMYQRIQKLADIKIKTFESNNPELKEAIEMIEKAFSDGIDCNYSQIEKLYYFSSCTEVERQAFHELFSIIA